MNEQSEQVLTGDQAYAATFLFLLQLVDRYPKDLNVFVWYMVLDPDGESDDPAFKEDWLDSVERVGKETRAPDLVLTRDEAYDATVLFLERWWEQGRHSKSDKGVGAAMQDLRKAERSPPNQLWREWDAAVDRAISERPAAIWRWPIAPEA